MSDANAGRPLMKEGLNAHALTRLAEAVAGAWPGFDKAGFLEEANSGLDDLELKDRVLHIIAVMNGHLPSDYPQALETVIRAGERFPPGRSGDSLAGFAAWPLIDWVGEFGLSHFDASLSALRKLTSLFSAEFGRSRPPSGIRRFTAAPAVGTAVAHVCPRSVPRDRVVESTQG